MIITRVVEKNREIIISFDGGQKIKCPSYVFFHTEIYEGMDVDPREIKELVILAERETVRTKATELVGSSTISVHQLKEKLRKRGYSERLIKDAIKFCKEYDLVDDKRFAKIARRTLLFKNKSRRSIASYMKKAGISDRLIERNIDSITDRRERHNLRVQMEKHYPLCANKKSPEKSLLQFLVGKGFTYDMAIPRVKKYCAKMKKLEEN